MTPNDPYTALLDQLAAHAEQLTRLDARETQHHTASAAQLADLTRLAADLSRALEDHSAALTGRTANGDADADPDGYQPGPPPAWRNLTPGERQEPVARLRAWVEQVYRPGYGHLAAELRPCWETHDLCLYALDILSVLWSVLYLQPSRTPGLVSAQAEYQARILPALAAQLAAETTRCGHPHHPAPPAARPWTRP